MIVFAKLKKNLLYRLVVVLARAGWESTPIYKRLRARWVASHPPTHRIVRDHEARTNRHAQAMTKDMNGFSAVQLSPDILRTGRIGASIIVTNTGTKNIVLEGAAPLKRLEIPAGGSVRVASPILEGIPIPMSYDVRVVEWDARQVIEGMIDCYVQSVGFFYLHPGEIEFNKKLRADFRKARDAFPLTITDDIAAN
jgi:hypothetical protein